MKEFVEIHFDEIATLRGWQAPTKLEYSRILERTLKNFNIPIKNITFGQLLTLCQETSGANGQPPSIHTVKKRLTVFHDIYIYAKYKNLLPNIFEFGGYRQYLQSLKSLEANPIKNTNLPLSNALSMTQSTTLNRKMRRALSINNVKAMTTNFANNAPEGDGELMGCVICFYLGLRPAECRALTYGDIREFISLEGRHYMVISKIQQPDGTIVDKTKTASSFRLVPIHIELEYILEKRIAYIRSMISPEININQLPIVCHQHNYTTYSNHAHLGAYASKMLKRYIDKEFMDYCYLDACVKKAKEDADAHECLSLYCLRRNFMTSLTAYTSLNEDEQKYCMGHMNRNADRFDINLLYNNEDRRIAMIPKLDQWLCNIKLHEALLTHHFTADNEIYNITNAVVQTFSVSRETMPNGGELKITIEKYYHCGETALTVASSPRHFETAPTITITHSSTNAAEAVQLPRPNLQKKHYDLLV